MPQQPALQASLQRCRKEGIGGERVSQQVSSVLHGQPNQQQGPLQERKRSSCRSSVSVMDAVEPDCGKGTPQLAFAQEVANAFCCASKPPPWPCDERVLLHQQQQSEELISPGAPNPVACCSEWNRRVKSASTFSVAQRNTHSSISSLRGGSRSNSNLFFQDDRSMIGVPASCDGASLLSSDVPMVGCLAPGVVTISTSTVASSGETAANREETCHAPAGHANNHYLPLGHAVSSGILNCPRASPRAAAVPYLPGNSLRAGVAAEPCEAIRTASTTTREKTSGTLDYNATADGAASIASLPSQDTPAISACRYVQFTSSARQSPGLVASTMAMSRRPCTTLRSSAPLPFHSLPYNSANIVRVGADPAAVARPVSSRLSDSALFAFQTSRLSSYNAVSTSASVAPAPSAAAAVASSPAVNIPAARASPSASARLAHWQETDQGLRNCHRPAEATSLPRLSVDTLHFSSEGTPPAHRLSSSVIPPFSSAFSEDHVRTSSSFLSDNYYGADATQNNCHCRSSNSSTSLGPSSSFYPENTAATTACGAFKGEKEEIRHSGRHASAVGCTDTHSEDVDVGSGNRRNATSFSPKISFGHTSLCTTENNFLHAFSSAAASCSRLHEAQSAAPALSSQRSSGYRFSPRRQPHALQRASTLSPAAVAHVSHGAAARLSAAADTYHDAVSWSRVAAKDASSGATRLPTVSVGSRARRHVARSPRLSAASVDVAPAFSRPPAASMCPQTNTASSFSLRSQQPSTTEELHVSQEQEASSVTAAAHPCQTAPQQDVGSFLRRQVATPRHSDPLHERRREWHHQPRHSAVSVMPAHNSDESIPSVLEKSSSSSFSNRSITAHYLIETSAATSTRSRYHSAVDDLPGASAADSVACSQEGGIRDDARSKRDLREKERHISEADISHERDGKYWCMQRMHAPDTVSLDTVGCRGLERELQPHDYNPLNVDTRCAYVNRGYSSRNLSQKMHVPATNHETLPDAKSPVPLGPSEERLEKSGPHTGWTHAADETRLSLDGTPASSSQAPPARTATLSLTASQTCFGMRNVYKVLPRNASNHSPTHAAAGKSPRRQSAMFLEDAALLSRRLPPGDVMTTAQSPELEKIRGACNNYRKQTSTSPSSFNEQLAAAPGPYTEYTQNMEKNGFEERLRARRSAREELIPQNRQSTIQPPLSSCISHDCATNTTNDVFTTTAKERFVSSVMLREGCSVTLPPPQQHQRPPHQVEDTRSALGTATGVLLRKQSHPVATPAENHTHRGDGEFSVYDIDSAFPSSLHVASRTAASRLSEPGAVEATQSAVSFSPTVAAGTHAPLPPTAAASLSPRLPAAAVNPAAASQASVAQPAATGSTLSQRAVPSVAAPSLTHEKTSGKCCLPPLLRRQFRVLQQVGKGMYGEVFVCALRRSPVAASAKQQKQKQQQQPTRISQQQYRRHKQQRCHQPSPAAAQQQHQQGQLQYEQQQELSRLSFDWVQEHLDRDMEVEDVQMQSAVRSSKRRGYHTSPRSNYHDPRRPCLEQQRTQRTAAASSAAGARSATGAAIAANRVGDCMQRTPTTTGGAAEVEWGDEHEREGFRGYPERETHREQEEEEMQEEENERNSHECEEQQLYAMKRVRLPTSKLKAIFGIEQQILREITLLGSLKHVNILRLHTFHFELERWVRHTSVLNREQPPDAVVLQQQQQHPQQSDNHIQEETKKQKQVVIGKEHTWTHKMIQEQHNTATPAPSSSVQHSSLSSSAAECPAVTCATGTSASSSSSVRQQTVATTQQQLRAGQRYRPTFYLFFELCECDLAQLVDRTYENYLEFWKTRVKEPAAAQATSPADVIQHLLQTSPEIIPRPGLDEEEVQLIAYQLFQAVAYCHSRDVMHRDIKPQNIMLLLDKEAGEKPHCFIFVYTLAAATFLYNVRTSCSLEIFTRHAAAIQRQYVRASAMDTHTARELSQQELLRGKRVVKLGDFGLACHAYTREACRTQEVVTLLYRPPELLMGCTDYTTAVDVWSAGIVVAEMILGRPPFRGQAGEADLLSRMQQWLGSPTSAEMQRLSVQPAALAEILKKREPPLSANATREDRLKLLLTDQFNRTLLSDSGIHFLASVLETDPEERPSAAEMLQHPWLRSALDKFGNSEVYLRPVETTLPPDFLAVDPINFSFYFTPAQLADLSDDGRVRVQILISPEDAHLQERKMLLSHSIVFHFVEKKQVLLARSIHFLCRHDV